MSKPNDTQPRTAVATAAEPKPTKRLQVKLDVTIEVDEGDFQAISEAMAHIGMAAEHIAIDHKSTKTVRR